MKPGSPVADQGDGERLLASLIACAEDAIATIDLEGTILLINDAGWRLFGAGSAAEMIGTSALEVVPPEDRAEARSILAAVRERESLRNREVDVLRRDGTSVPVEMTVSLLRGADAAPIGFLFIARDIRERRRARLRTELLLEIARSLSSCTEQGEAIEYVQRRTAAVLECDAVATFLWSPEHRAFRLLGQYKSNDALDLDLSPLELDADHPAVHRFATSPTVELDPVQAGDELGAWFVRSGLTAVAWTQLVVRDRARGALAAFTSQPGRAFEQSEIEMLEGVARQLALYLDAAHLYRTKEAEAEVAGALARAGHDLMLDLERSDLPDRICELTTQLLDCDSAHTLLRAGNDDAYAVAGAYGYAPELDEGFRVLRLPPDVLEATRAEVLVEEVHLIDIERSVADDPMRRAAVNLGLRWVLCMPIRRAGEIVGLHFACRRSAERPFVEHERRIARGFARLASIALQCRAALEGLESANRLKSEFVAAISHELRTPLSIMMGYSSLLLEGAYGSVPAEQRQALDRIDRNATTLLELISGMLDLSRLEAGRVRVDLGDVDLGALFAAIAGETRELCKPGVSLTWDAGGVAALRTDALKLKVVLKNLVTNALKFTAAGKVELMARDDGHGVEIEVRDSGCGVAPADLTSIFEAFRQGTEESTRATGGVGLGLYIAKRMVEALGGGIGVDSEVGRGSTFTLWLPRSPKVSAGHQRA